MGWWNRVKNFGKSVVSGVKKVGSFVKEKAIPFIGKASGVARKVGEFLGRPEVNAILDVLGTIPVVGSVAKVAQKGGQLARTAGRIGEDVTKFGEGVVSAVENKDLSKVPELIQQGKGIYEDVQSSRRQGLR